MFFALKNRPNGESRRQRPLGVYDGVGGRLAARAIVVGAVVIIIGTLSFGERRCNIFNKVFTIGQGMIYENEWKTILMTIV